MLYDMILLMSKKFQRTIENFTCEHCRAKVKGNGYTNHCPNCLWSKHVDVSPGDREGQCGGTMPPVRFEIKNSVYFLIHKCEKCDLEKKNRLAQNDSPKALIKLSKTFQNFPKPLQKNLKFDILSW